MTDRSNREVTMVAVDGRDALAYVIIKPNSAGDGVFIDAAADGISKPQAAYVLRHLAQQWDPGDEDIVKLVAEREAYTRVARELRQVTAERDRLAARVAELEADGA